MKQKKIVVILKRICIACRRKNREDGYDIGPVIKHESPFINDYKIMNLATKFYQNTILTSDIVQKMMTFYQTTL